MGIIDDYGMILLILAVLFGIFMAWGVGANDVANAMGTSVGAKAITIKQAIIIAMVFEFAGAYLAGGEVTSTIRKGIINADALAGTPELFVYGMLAALLAAGTWLLIATAFGWPVSTTHSIVGAIIGFACVGIGFDSVQWPKVAEIASSWVISPIMAGTLSFCLYMSVKKFIFGAPDAYVAAKRYVPVYIFMVGYIVSMVTLVKGLKHIGLEVTFQQALIYSLGAAMVIASIGIYGLSRIKQ